MIDSHGHLNFHTFTESYGDIIERAKAAGVHAIVVPSTQLESSQQALKIAREYPDYAFPAVGQHPTHVEKHPFDIAAYRTLAEDPRVVAIGEIGLDAHRDEAKATLAAQKVMLQAQLDLAVELDKPVIIHCRNAYQELLKMFGAMPKVPRGVLHCFAPVEGAGYAEAMTAQEVADAFVALGFYISFAGIITYPKNGALRDVAAQLPLDRILTETDAPFLSPQKRRSEPNEPAFMVDTVTEIARARGVPFATIATATEANARALFNLPTA